MEFIRELYNDVATAAGNFFTNATFDGPDYDGDGTPVSVPLPELTDKQKIYYANLSDRMENREEEIAALLNREPTAVLGKCHKLTPFEAFSEKYETRIRESIEKHIGHDLTKPVTVYLQPGDSVYAIQRIEGLRSEVPRHYRNNPSSWVTAIRMQVERDVYSSGQMQIDRNQKHDSSMLNHEGLIPITIHPKP